MVKTMGKPASIFPKNPVLGGSCKASGLRVMMAEAKWQIEAILGADIGMRTKNPWKHGDNPWE
jgi:hypothetical protein